MYLKETSGRTGRTTVAVFALAAMLVPTADAAPTTDSEIACQAKTAKALGKLAKIVDKGVGKCRDGVIADKASLPCPDAKAQGKIDKLSGKLLDAINGNCGSVCSTSTGVTCLSDTHCPPDGASAETCAGDGGSTPAFAMENLGFPGTLCEASIGGPIADTDDLYECLTTLLDSNRNLESMIWGSIDTAGEVSSSAAKCLASAGKATQKLAQTIFKGVGKCREDVNKGKSSVDPVRCTVDDAKLADKIAKADTKLAASVQKKCTDPLVAELDLCGAGVGGTLTVAEAVDCLTDVGHEASDTLVATSSRLYVAASLVDIMYPSGTGPGAGTCGDGIVNQLPNAFALIGEECDLDDDAACPGECLPPGDLFECTCADVPRVMNFAIGSTSDLEIGWSGFSHDHLVSESSAFIVDLANCDCDVMSGAECVGTSADSECDTSGRQAPTCSWDLFGATRCDDHGNANLFEEDADCFICDAFSSNAGAFCETESDCDSQCHDAVGTPTGPCSDQGDCAAGETCRGRCDTSQSCVQIPHGSPLAQSTGGAPSCLGVVFREDMTGTQNIVTGEHARFQERTAFGHTGHAASSPCPVCGGVCAGLPISSIVLDRPCQGTCSISPDRCRLDSDCPSGETCTSTSLECGDGFCDLALLCHGGSRDGLACRLEGPSQALGFGTTSNDCPPDPALNFSGAGTDADFLPATSEPVSLTSEIGPCSNPAFALYDCLCPDVGGLASRPNNCSFACNAGAELGAGCGTTGLPIGQATVCLGGDNAGIACDEDSDCAPGGGSCTDNPFHCDSTNPATAGAPCSGACTSDYCLGSPTPCGTNVDCIALGECGGNSRCVGDNSILCGTNADCDRCEGKSCTYESDCPDTPTCLLDDAPCAGGFCIDACPSGDCVPLCLPSAGDPEDGDCAAGPVQNRCSGPRDTWRVCTAGNAAGSCSATCSLAATACMADTDCPSGETCNGACSLAGFCEAGLDGVLGSPDDIPGAGICVSGPLDCPLADFAAEGGDIFNGEGDPINNKSVSAYCIAANPSPAANVGAGLPGPGRLRSETVNLTNGFTSLP